MTSPPTPGSPHDSNSVPAGPLGAAAAQKAAGRRVLAAGRQLRYPAGPSPARRFSRKTSITRRWRKRKQGQGESKGRGRSRRAGAGKEAGGQVQVQGRRAGAGAGAGSAEEEQSPER
eukprot:768620-Hanusia_phi.AAC.1